MRPIRTILLRPRFRVGESKPPGIIRPIDAFDFDSPNTETSMTWETPTIEDIACGMQVTAYAPGSGRRPACRAGRGAFGKSEL